MVLLTMTPAVVRALEAAKERAPKAFEGLERPSEPALAAAEAGNPISHSQLIDLSKLLKEHTYKAATAEHEDTKPDEYKENSDDDETPLPVTLDALLRGSRVYVPPPPPKKEPTPEYTRLMARLRAEEEARAYERMTNPNPLATPESFAQRFPNAPRFTVGANVPTSEEEELSYDEVHRQIILIINVIVSIVACAVFVWVAARHWSVPKRLGLSMGSSGAVAIAEVVVYSGYVRKVTEAKRKERKKPEIKEIVESWVIDGRSDKESIVVNAASNDKTENNVRYRKGKHR